MSTFSSLCVFLPCLPLFLPPYLTSLCRHIQALTSRLSRSSYSNTVALISEAYHRRLRALGTNRFTQMGSSQKSSQSSCHCKYGAHYLPGGGLRCGTDADLTSTRIDSGRQKRRFNTLLAVSQKTFNWLFWTNGVKFKLISNTTMGFINKTIVTKICSYENM